MSKQKFDESSRKFIHKEHLNFIQRFERSITEANKYYVTTIDIDSVAIKYRKSDGEPVAFMDYQHVKDLNHIDTTEKLAGKFESIRGQGKIVLKCGFPIYIIFYNIKDDNVDDKDKTITMVRVYDYLLEKMYPVWTPKQYGHFLNHLDKIDKKIYDEKYRKPWIKYGWFEPD